MLRVTGDPVSQAQAVREAKAPAKQQTLAAYFAGPSKSFAGVNARLDRRAAEKGLTTSGAISEHEQQQANVAAEQAIATEKELAGTVQQAFVMQGGGCRVAPELKRKRGMAFVPTQLTPTDSHLMPDRTGASAEIVSGPFPVEKQSVGVVVTQLVVTMTGTKTIVRYTTPSVDPLGLIGKRLDEGKSLAASITRRRHMWNGTQKNEYVAYINIYGGVKKMLAALRAERHNLLPAPQSLWKWKAEYEKNGPFSPLESAELRSRAITTGMMGDIGVEFDNAVGLYVKFLLGLGMKGNPNLLITAGKTVQKDPRWKGTTNHHKKIADLKFSPGWVQKHKERKALVPRVGDKLKMNKFPPAAQIDATQTVSWIPLPTHTGITVHPPACD